MIRSPKVLHILAPAREGGLETVVTMLATLQADEGVHVAAVLEPKDFVGHPFVRRLESVGVPITPIVVGGRSYFKEYRALRAMIHRLRPSVVHTHGYRSDLIGTAAAHRCGVPAVSTVHGFTGGSLRNRLNEIAQGIVLRRSDAVIAVSAPLVHRLHSAGVPRSRIFSVRNGFFAGDQTLDRDSARKGMGLDDGKLVAGWVGRLSTEKGADVMLVALSTCDRQWNLSIVGEGPERYRLQRLSQELGIAERVTWHGTVPNAAAIFPAFDAFVLSSRTEGTPMSLFEAMETSVPVIATKVGGVPDVVTSEHALLVPPEDPAAIAAALNDIARNRVAASERALRARERLHSEFGEKVWMSSLNAVYEAAIDARRQG